MNILDDIVTLRCKYCGAPLDKKDLESNDPYVTCSSCGTTQQRIDAKAYLDQMMGQVQNWISKALPGGFSLSQSENVDSVARYNIFNTNIKPKIDAEYTEYKFATNTLISNPMMVLPFTTDNSAVPVHSSTKAFEFNAKAKSVEALAVDVNSKALITDAEDLASAYALIINNTKLLQEDKPGRYILLANNFTEAAKAFSKVKGYGSATTRFEALAQISTGCEKLLNGDAMGSQSYFEQGTTKLEALKTNLFSDMNLGIMYQAVNLEISQAHILTDISRFITTGVSSDPLKILNVIKKVFTFQYAKSGNWGYLLSNKDRFNEIFEYLSNAMSAKNGKTLPITAGSGDYLIPFWDIDLKYSFQTGMAWKKKSVEVSEDILVPADFVIDSACLSNPSSALTDIFSIRPEKSILAGISGSETSISGGEGIGKLSMASQNSPGARKIVIPLSTKKEAEKVVTDYLTNRMSSDSKLKLSKPYVKCLIYIPCKINGDNLAVPEEFGSLIPERTRRTKVSELITI